MVDSIKNQTVNPQSSAVSKQTNSSALRESFKNLSSGLSVSQSLKDAPVVVHIQGARGSGQLGKVVTNLNDAVKSSKETLKSLEDSAAAAADGSETEVVRAFAEDLQKLKSDIVELLETLRKRAGTAEVLNENMEAADVKLEDVEKARETAESMQSSMQTDNNKALSAHHGLSLERVTELLAE